MEHKTRLFAAVIAIVAFVIVASIGWCCYSYIRHSPSHIRLTRDIVQVGMETSSVLKTIGKPDSVVSSKNAVAPTEVVWVYHQDDYELREGRQLGGLNIFIVNNKVVKIVPIESFVHVTH